MDDCAERESISVGKLGMYLHWISGCFLEFSEEALTIVLSFGLFYVMFMNITLTCYLEMQ